MSYSAPFVENCGRRTTSQYNKFRYNRKYLLYYYYTIRTSLTKRADDLEWSQ